MFPQREHRAVWLRATVLLGFVAYACCKCFGDNCTKNEAAAAKAGLLGATPGSTPSCAAGTRKFAFERKWMTTFESTIYSVVWAGSDDEWVWAITSGARFNAEDPHRTWVSSDHGRTFKDVFPDLVEAIKKLKGKKYDTKHDVEHAGVGAIYVNSKDPKKTLLWGDGSILFTTLDGGKTFKAAYMPNHTLGFSHTVRQHPTQPDWILSLAYRRVCYSFGAVDCQMDLYLTTDFGASWKDLTKVAGSSIVGFTDFDWGYHNGDAKYLSLFEEKTILAAGRVSKSSGLYDGAEADVHVFRSDNFFKSNKLLALCGSEFELLAGQIYLARPDNCPVDINGKPVTSNLRNSHISLFVSENGGQNFGEVCLPTPLAHKGFTMISTHDKHGAFIVADHDPSTSTDSKQVSNMYANGHIPELFSLSLRNLYFGMPRGGFPDVTTIEPIPGRYIANQELSTNLKSPYIITSTHDTVIVTKITHNSGASWEYIAVDPADVKHDVCKGSCTSPEGCYLHLHGFSSWKGTSTSRPAVYASKAAPGLVMASGNLGPEKEGLQSDKDRLCTWLSRDGGLTWRDVVDDLYIYEYLNHGNVIAMAKFREEGPADELFVSLDQGKCWMSIAIVNEKVSGTLFVNNIRVEPDGAATILHVTGSQHIEMGAGLMSKQDVMVTIDLREVLKKGDSEGRVLPPRDDCDGMGDMEEWTATDESGNKLCILGNRHTFQRRKLFNSATCLLRKDYDLGPEQVDPVPCDCKKADLYCEYGYEKTGASTCGPILYGQAPVCAAIKADLYKVSDSHMRLTHHEICPNLAAFISDTDGMGSMGSRTAWTKPFDKQNSSGWFWKFIVVVLVFVVGTAAFCKFAKEEHKDKLYMITEPVVGAIMWAMEAVQKLYAKATSSGATPESHGFQPLGDSNEDHLYAAP